MDPQQMRKKLIFYLCFQKIYVRPPTNEKMQICIFQKISRFSTFGTPHK